jgi:hypothetical protein
MGLGLTQVWYLLDNAFPEGLTAVLRPILQERGVPRLSQAPLMSRTAHPSDGNCYVPELTFVDLQTEGHRRGVLPRHLSSSGHATLPLIHHPNASSNILPPVTVSYARWLVTCRTLEGTQNSGRAYLCMQPPVAVVSYFPSHVSVFISLVRSLKAILSMHCLCIPLH